MSTRALIINADDLGVVAPSPGRPCRLVRCVWLDDGNYVSGVGRSSMRLANAREPIVPVALDIY